MAALKKKTLKREVHLESGLPTNEGRKNTLEISFPGKIVANLSETIPEYVEVSAPGSLNLRDKPSTSFGGAEMTKLKTFRVPPQDKIVPLPKKGEDLSFANADKDQSHTNVLNKESCQASGGIDGKMKNMRSSSPQLLKPIFWNKNLVKRKIKAESEYTSSKSHVAKDIVNLDVARSGTTSELVTSNHESKANGKLTAESNNGSARELNDSGLDSRVNQILAAKVDNVPSGEAGKADGKTRSREKGEFSNSSKSSIGEFSSSTSDGSSSSGSSRCCNRPHICIDPFCAQSSWQISCFTPRLLTAPSKTRKQKSEQAIQ
ncbi:Serine/threonine-protein kinase KIPK2, partial [Bienertia sinuspersici]